MAIELGISLMVEDDFRQAVLPLLEDGLIDALEYSFEVGWTPRGVPLWADALLDHYAAAGRLWGHGVTMSAFSCDDGGHHQRWLARVAAECGRRPYRGVSEHYGYMREGDIDGGAPLPPPPIAGTEHRGRIALETLATTTGTAVGLENLALALSEPEVWWQGPALGRMLDAVDGYLVLDLHNLDCQIRNFGADPSALLDSYPLSRARCIHVSGGSWSTPMVGGQRRRFRRDTHDDAIPSSVLALLDLALPRCDNLQTVIVERLGDTIDDGAAFRAEILSVLSAVREAIA